MFIELSENSTLVIEYLSSISPIRNETDVTRETMITFEFQNLMQRHVPERIFDYSKEHCGSHLKIRSPNRNMNDAQWRDYTAIRDRVVWFQRQQSDTVKSTLDRAYPQRNYGVISVVKAVIITLKRVCPPMKLTQMLNNFFCNGHR